MACHACTLSHRDFHSSGHHVGGDRIPRMREWGDGQKLVPWPARAVRAAFGCTKPVLNLPSFILATFWPQDGCHSSREKKLRLKRKWDLSVSLPVLLPGLGEKSDGRLGRKQSPNCAYLTSSVRCVIPAAILARLWQLCKQLACCLSHCELIFFFFCHLQPKQI